MAAAPFRAGAGARRHQHRCAPLRATHQELANAMRQLQQQLQEAVSREDYAQAAELKRSLESLEQQDPVATLRKQLKQAVAEERYPVGHGPVLKGVGGRGCLTRVPMQGSAAPGTAGAARVVRWWCSWRVALHSVHNGGIATCQG